MVTDCLIRIIHYLFLCVFMLCFSELVFSVVDLLLFLCVGVTDKVKTYSFCRLGNASPEIKLFNVYSKSVAICYDYEGLSHIQN